MDKKSGDGSNCLATDLPLKAPLSGRTGAIVMRSVSIFLASGRKISSNASSRRQRSGSSSIGIKKRFKMPIDETVGQLNHRAKVIEVLRKKTKFTKQELESLCNIYTSLTCNTEKRADRSSVTINATNNELITNHVDGIDRTIFRELLHNTFDVLTEDTLIERMFSCWDKNNEGTIKLESWIVGLDVFLRGTVQEKMDFCFRVYDLNNDGFITKDEIFQLFKHCLMKQPGEEDPEEGVKDLSEMALKKLDFDHDGKISFLDYNTIAREEPLLLEAFGQILPTPESISAFILTLKP